MARSRRLPGLQKTLREQQMQVAMNSATNEAISTDNDISNSKHFNPFYSSVMEFQRPCVSVF